MSFFLYLSIFFLGKTACEVEIRHWWNPTFKIWQENGVRMGCKRRGACRRQKDNNYRILGKLGKVTIPTQVCL